MGHMACTEPQCLYSRAIPLLPRMGHMACTEPQCLYSTAIPLLPLWAVWPIQSLSASTVELYLYSPYGPYVLYRASVPVQYSHTSTPLWAVSPVQSFSACTRVHFNFTFFFCKLKC